MADHWTTKELLESGLSEREIRRRLSEGTLYRLSRGIYTAEKPGPESALRALQDRHQGLIFTGVTAAGVYGLVPLGAPAVGILRHGSQPIRNQALHAVPSRRRRHLRINGINVTTPVAVTAELYPHHGFWDSVKFLEQSYDGLRGRENFAGDFKQLTPGQRAHLEPLLKRAVIGASSRMERLFIADLRKVGLDPTPNFRLGPYSWDVGLEPGTTVADLDSRIFHTTSPDNPVDNAFIIDRWKTNYAVENGWAGLRYTDECLRVIRRQVVEQIKEIVEYRRNTPGLRKRPRQVVGMEHRPVWEFHPELFP